MSVDTERDAAMVAVKVIEAAGGKMGYSEYGAVMKPIKYWKPMEWGLDALNKDNSDRLAVVTACKLGLVKQTDEGYEIK